MTIKLVAVHLTFQAWRYNYYPLLGKNGDLEVTVIHGPGVPGTKIVAAPDLGGVNRIELQQRVVMTGLTGRRAPLVAFKGLFRTLKRASPDVLLIEGGSNLLNSTFSLLWAKVHSVPVVWWTLGELPGRKYSRVGRIMRWFVAFMERRCDAMLLYSTQAFGYARRIGVPADRCFVAVNVVDTNSAAIASDRARSNAENYPIFERRGPVIVFVGALAPGKSLELLPDLLCELTAKRTDVRLLIIGSGILGEELKADFNQRGLSQNVIFAGQQRERLADWLACSDIGLLPGLGGLAVSEMMAHGLPVVCNGGDGSEKDLVQQGVTGFNIAGAEDPTVELARVLLELATDLERTRAMGKAARALVTTKHSGEAMVRTIEQAVRSVIRK